jgi:hypothetical protein
MIFTFLDFTSENAKNIFWAFCTFYGLTFAIGTESSSSDITRYVLELQWLFDQKELTLSEIVQYFVQSGEVDILRTILSYTVSRFTDSQAALTTVYAFIFGYFFSRNIWYVFGFLKGNLSIYLKILILALVLVVPIWFLGGFRMWTAFHIFMYGLLPYILENKKKRLLFVFLSFLVHFSYIIPITILLMYLILGNQLKLYFFVFVITIFATDIDVSVINEYIEKYAPVLIDERTSAYRSEDKVALVKESIENNSKNWYAIWYRKIMSWALYIIIFYFLLFANPLIKLLPEWKRLFSFTLMYYSCANILINMPSGIRFLNFSFFLTITMIILYLNQFRKDSKFKDLIMLLSPAFLLFIVVSIRLGFYNTSISTIMGNPVIAFFTAGNNISLNDLIK